MGGHDDQRAGPNAAPAGLPARGPLRDQRVPRLATARALREDVAAAGAYPYRINDRMGVAGTSLARGIICVMIHSSHVRTPVVDEIFTCIRCVVSVTKLLGLGLSRLV